MSDQSRQNPSRTYFSVNSSGIPIPRRSSPSTNDGGRITLVAHPPSSPSPLSSAFSPTSPLQQARPEVTRPQTITHETINPNITNLATTNPGSTGPVVTIPTISATRVTRLGHEHPTRVIHAGDPSFRKPVARVRGQNPELLVVPRLQGRRRREVRRQESGPQESGRQEGGRPESGESRARVAQIQGGPGVPLGRICGGEVVPAGAGGPGKDGVGEKSGRGAQTRKVAGAWCVGGTELKRGATSEKVPGAAGGKAQRARRATSHGVLVGPARSPTPKEEGQKGRTRAATW